MEVKVKDRKEEIEFLRMACNMAELGIGYQHADLIIRLQERLKKLKGIKKAEKKIADKTKDSHYYGGGYIGEALYGSF